MNCKDDPCPFHLRWPGEADACRDFDAAEILSLIDEADRCAKHGDSSEERMLARWVLALAAQLRRREATPGRAGEDGELDHQDALALRRDLAAAHDMDALSARVFQWAKIKSGDLLLVPYLGTGPDLPAAEALGLRVIACDVSEEACRVAVGARLHAAPVVESPGPLFAPRPT